MPRATARSLARTGCALGLVAALSGCGTAASGPSPAADRGSTPATVVPSSRAPATPAGSGATVVLVRSGGLVPGSAAVRVGSDGTVRQGTSAQTLGPSVRAVAASTLARLQADLRDPQLRSAHYAPGSGCCDRRLLVLTVSGVGPTYTVTAVEGDTYPPVLQRVLGVLVPMLPPIRLRPTVAPR